MSRLVLVFNVVNQRVCFSTRMVIKTPWTRPRALVPANRPRRLDIKSPNLFQQQHMPLSPHQQVPVSPHNAHLQQQQPQQHMSPPPMVSSSPPVSQAGAPPSAPPTQQPQQQSIAQAAMRPPPNSCIRHGCTNRAVSNPEWEDEYCSNECVVSHCRDVFSNWVADNKNQQQNFSTVK